MTIYLPSWLLVSFLLLLDLYSNSCSSWRLSPNSIMNYRILSKRLSSMTSQTFLRSSRTGPKAASVFLHFSTSSDQQLGIHSSIMKKYDTIGKVNHFMKPSHPPVASHVRIDPIIMSYLNLKQHLRKSRFLLSTKDECPLTVKTLRQMIEKRYPGLEDKPYRLQYLLHGDKEETMKTLFEDSQLQQALRDASIQGRAFQLHVNCVIGLFPPPDFPLPLSADPRETDSFTMVSFFSFHKITDTNQTAEDLHRMWTPLKALGRVYVANEGINAQMAIPTNVFEDFKKITKANPLFQDSRFNTDPAIPKDEYFKYKPFRALHVRVRDQIVADGLDEELDWKDSGNELEPLEWHQALDDPNAIILDCRNTYETDVGIFDKAIPLNTTFFRESWVALDEVLKDKPKDSPVLTYCTGGIRCVKINAYLEQKMGFTNTHRLKGGVIAYRRELEEHAKKSVQSDDSEHSSIPELSSKFKGVNYVFDERIVERITEDCFGKCESCGTPNDSFTNCKNVNCNVRFIQCPGCRGAYHNCCSLACRQEFDLSQATETTRTVTKLTKLNGKESLKQLHSRVSKLIVDNQLIDEEPKIKSHAMSDDSLQKAVNSYCEMLSEKEPVILKQLREETTLHYPHAASRMISGPSQGSLLSLLATLNQAKTVLELGTFTGYSSISMAMNFDEFTTGKRAEATRNNTERKVYTCEIDSKAIEIAERTINGSAFKDNIFLHKVTAHDMLQRAKEDNLKFDMVFIDADKRSYLDYLCALLGSDSSSSLLNPGALVIIDNTLWKGLVLNQIPQLQNAAPDAQDFGAPNRFNKIAQAMHSFNEYCANHKDLRTLMLPMRDGLTIIKYSPMQCVL